MKLMACIDGTGLSQQVLEPVANLIEKSGGGEIHFVRVLDLSGVYESTRGRLAPNRRATAEASGGNLPGSGGAFQSRGRREAQAMVEDRGQAISRAENEAIDDLRALSKCLPGEHVFTILDGSDSADEIATYADAHDIDVIAMPTRSRRRVGKMIFGSTTSAVVEKGVAPVLVVHPK
jgi:nucleotide-binding universal stress UspA family protein